MVLANIYSTNMYNESHCKRCLCVVYRELRSFRRLADLIISLKKITCDIFTVHISNTITKMKKSRILWKLRPLSQPLSLNIPLSKDSVKKEIAPYLSTCNCHHFVKVLELINQCEKKWIAAFIYIHAMSSFLPILQIPLRQRLSNYGLGPKLYHSSRHLSWQETGHC